MLPSSPDQKEPLWPPAGTNLRTSVYQSCNSPRPKTSLKRSVRRVRRSRFPFPLALSPSLLTSVPPDFSMIPIQFPQPSPGAGSHIALAALRECAHWLPRPSCGPITLQKIGSRVYARPRPASIKEGLGSSGDYGNCSFLQCAREGALP